MARKTTRKTAPKPTRRGLNPATLPYADETQAANDVIDFLFMRLPDFIARELRNIDIAIDRANLYRELSGLSDSALKKAGLKRSDLPALVVRTLRLIEVSNGRTAKRRSPAVKRTTTKRKAAKRTSGRGARA
jgi:hypothetical protein